MNRRVLLALVLFWLVSSTDARLAAQVSRGSTPTPPGAAASDAAETVRIRELLQRIEQAARNGTADAYAALLTPAADRTRATDFVSSVFKPGSTRLLMIERERLTLNRTVSRTVAYRVVVDMFAEYGDSARVATLQFEMEPQPDGLPWRLADQDSLSSVDKLFRLSVSKVSQFEAHNFVVTAEDLQLTLVDGVVFRVDTSEGPTGLVLLGTGDLRFSPAPDTEKGQVRIFAGDSTLTTRFDGIYLRFNDVKRHADLSQLTARPTDPRMLKRAEQLFREESAKSFVIDLADLSREAWSLLPGEGDFLAEIRTKKYGTLTYARSSDEPEDIAFFERRRSRNIAVYASTRKLAERGRFYDEDALAAYDVLNYDLDLNLDPERLWLDGAATMRLRVKRTVAAQLTIRLADSLVVRSIESDRFGRLFGLRARGQNAILISLPLSMMPESEISLTIEYAGRLAPQAPDRENIGLQQDAPQGFGSGSDLSNLPAVQRGEPNFVYSNLTYWYPQAPITDYATALMHITVPSPYVVVGSGKVDPKSPLFVTAVGSQPGKLYMFRAERPVRYLSFVVSKFEKGEGTTVAFAPRTLPPSTVPPRVSGAGIVMVAQNAPPRPEPPPPVFTSLAIDVEANPRQASHGREHVARATEIARFYDSVIGDIPYDSFTMALTEWTTPGGHSPGYFAILNQPLPAAAGTLTYRNDPAAFDNFPEFFVAHELAHQWWGQAIGWRNYHEQWLSEGFSQYFAALYAGHARGPEAFGSVIRYMRKWAVDASDQGPVFLGYRLGHIRNDGRVNRALVYNKGGVVLHMLRRYLGDEAFFAGLRRFYADWRYRKAGTDDLRVAMEATSGKPLDRFFERWIYNQALPSASLSTRVEGQQLQVRIEQKQTDLFDYAVTLSLNYADRPAATVTIPVSERVTDATIPLQGTLREAELDRNDGLLVDIQRLP